jgi:hypothetical protein
MAEVLQLVVDLRARPSVLTFHALNPVGDRESMLGTALRLSGMYEVRDVREPRHLARSASHTRRTRSSRACRLGDVELPNSPRNHAPTRFVIKTS